MGLGLGLAGGSAPSCMARRAAATEAPSPLAAAERQAAACCCCSRASAAACAAPVARGSDEAYAEPTKSVSARLSHACTPKCMCVAQCVVRCVRGVGPG